MSDPRFCRMCGVIVSEHRAEDGMCPRIMASGIRNGWIEGVSFMPEQPDDSPPAQGK